ncbi:MULTISPECIES: branched-chain amino acid ABC transporter permease [unclassified Microbacterium]|uniref:branched-chain amino acid ABC transporter permease n=1 Tax=unclassified Microbacterium TaxID=2609290 RepID=UPI000EA9A59B|nr:MULTISPECIES: branched-chain amino acid ABC transporter permease [unclassified Microbacterium]MBT2486458.1 branched-chain amino acid ABC transporter permease [Microbacterium sp. ISL-108]RKN69156.1 branched-chain amino acid ABC transporter permease [Microbacterium sp. CGR2]
MTTILHWLPRIATGVAIVIAVSIPFLVTDYDLFAMSRVLAVALGVISLNLLMGFSGQISLGQGAIFGIGGYASMLVIRHLEWPVALALVAAVVVCAIVGAIIGLPGVRLGGFNLGLLTIVIAALFPIVLYRLPDFTGGQAGITLSGGGLFSPTGALTDAQWIYLVLLVVLLLSILGVRNLVSRRIGRALAAVRANPILAASVGVETDRLKLALFVISSAVAGLGGALYALVLGLVVPESYPLVFSITLLVASVVGGNRSWWGAIIGAVVIVYLPTWFSEAVPGDTSAYLAQLVFAVVLGACIIIAPSGAAGLIGRGYRALARTATRDIPSTREETQ